MNWTAILSGANIPEPPGRTDTVAQAIVRHQSQLQAAAAAITSKRATATTSR